jgi:hypothetical protein
LSILSDGLLGEGWMDLKFFNGPDMSGSRYAQAISSTDGHRISPEGNWFGVREEGHQALGIFSQEIAELKR